VTLSRRATSALLALGPLYAALASFTHPFTVAADVVTAIPLVGVFALVLVTQRRPARAAASTGSAIRSRGVSVWLAALAVLAAWELYCDVHQPRQAHPTLSVLIDLLDRTHIGKTAAFAAWLALGWFLARR
jgi:hypothetical protein